MTMNIIDAAVVQAAINERFDSLYTRNDEGIPVPYVCISCDKLMDAQSVQLLKLNDLKKYCEPLKVSAFNKLERNEELRKCYIYKGRFGDESEEEDKLWIEELLLSPRGSFLRNFGNSKNDGFSVCGGCKSMLKMRRKPKFSIANNYCFGSPPACLTELTDLELAYITPVKTHGYCFSYTGGVQKQLKGSLSYYKVKIDSIAREVCTFDVLGLTKNIVVLLYGKMTPDQKKKAGMKNELRTDFVLRAVEWLIYHNEEWRKKNISLEAMRRTLQNPVLIDKSSIANGETSTDDNIEQTESFQVFFPDGTMSSTTGGQEKLKELKDLVYAATTAGYKLEVKSNLMKESVQDYKDNNLVNSCLLQYPYGRGGMNEEREKANGHITTSTDIKEYVEHLSHISQRHFHHALFSLILYNITFKQNMVRTAGWRTRNKLDAASIATELTPDDVWKAIDGKRRKQHAASDPGRTYLNAIDAVAGSIPHTNEATRKARREGEAYLHHYGNVSWFLTVTPDDDNSFLVQAYSGIHIDDGTPISDLSDEELHKRAKERTQLRIKVPGICAFFFEQVINIIIEEVLGWNMKGCCRMKRGMFGDTEAFLIAVEEQGRFTLHGHIQVWVKQFNELREQLHSGNHTVTRNAVHEICKATDAVASSSLVEFNCKKFKIPCAFPHENCTQRFTTRRGRPKVVDDQQIRNLRHIHGQKNDGGKFAKCPQCTKIWTNEQLIESYLMHEVKVPGLKQYPDRSARRLKAMAVEYQKSAPGSVIDDRILAAAYNHHIHTTSCFGKCSKKQKANGNESDNKNKKRKREKTEECRYRVPQRPNKATKIIDSTSVKVRWYKWNGSYEERHIKELVTKREDFDAFQNVCCPAISYSKGTCNTNISGVMSGPMAHYTFKYNMKETQDEDTEEYKNVSSMVQKALSRTRTSDSDSSEAIRRILCGSHAHQSTNIIGATLAAYLTRNKSRFIFSHKTVWCPLRDIKALLHGECANVYVQHKGKVPFFQCSALHYLCRPEELESYSAKEFYSEYEVIRSKQTNDQELLSFCNKEFTHPSYRQKGKRFLQGIKKREMKLLPRIFQYDFPDSASFGENILESSHPYNENMETYAQQVLLLFFPYRKLDDIAINGSYVDKLKEAVISKRISDSSLEMLQNILDAKANNLRYNTDLQDELQRCTRPFQPTIFQRGTAKDENEVVDDEGISGENLDAFLSAWDDELLNMEDESEENTNLHPEHVVPKSIDLNSVKQRGAHKCGYECLARMTRSQETEIEQFCQTQSDNDQPFQEVPENRCDQESTVPNQKEIVRIIFSKTSRRRKNLTEIMKREDDFELLEANGSARSIIDWAIKLGLDSGQKRAFEIICSTFVLTFFKEAKPDDRTSRQKFSSEMKKIKMLADRRKRSTDQLILFLHGPGGCGKSTVIDLVIEYAREYCSYMENYAFTKRTIVVTAMTGVAATILLGETTHSALHLNQKKPIDGGQIELWNDTKLLIIDEISFASKEDFREMHKKLGDLKERAFERYGGLSIVFSGDLRQLEPVGKHKNPIYEDDCPEFKDWVNSYLELSGKHRFKGDEEWGELLFRFRDGKVTKEDIQKINDRVVTQGTMLPENLRYATYFNKDRDAINAGLFEKRCREHYLQYGNVDDSVVIFSDNLQRKNGSKIYEKVKNRTAFWDNCGENDISFPNKRGRMDPVLRLYCGMRVMLPVNNNVSLGQANGTQATVKKIILKSGEQFQQTMLNGDIQIRAVFASQIDCIELEHTSDRIQPSTFTLKPKEFTFDARILKPRAYRGKPDERESIRMKATQLPIVVNNATTGHKLQGSGVDILFVHNWSYVTNWVYVMLSRVRTREGLYARKKLDENLERYKVPEALIRMLAKMKQKKEASFLSDDQYRQLLARS